MKLDLKYLFIFAVTISVRAVEILDSFARDKAPYLDLGKISSFRCAKFSKFLNIWIHPMAKVVLPLY